MNMDRPGTVKKAHFMDKNKCEGCHGDISLAIYIIIPEFKVPLPH